MAQTRGAVQAREFHIDGERSALARNFSLAHRATHQIRALKINFCRATAMSVADCRRGTAHHVAAELRHWIARVCWCLRLVLRLREWAKRRCHGQDDS